MRLLLVEDDAALADAVAKILEARGHETVCATTKKEAASLANDHFDVMVVDRLLPDGDGLDLVQDLRSRSNTSPVLILSALGSVVERVTGLQRGADDYLVKPFSMDELEARIEALARRQTSLPAKIVIGDLNLDRLMRTVRRGSSPITLMPREFQLLELLMLSSPSIVTRKMMLEQVWRIRFDPGTNIVETHVCRLRNKIDRGGDPPIIHTVRGEGYVVLEK